MRYDATNHLVLVSVPPRVGTVLDLGCGRGEIGGALRAARGCSVVGVTRSEEDAAFARQVVDRVEVLDLNDCDLTPLGTFECVLCSHVLEHL